MSGNTFDTGVCCCGMSRERRLVLGVGKGDHTNQTASIKTQPTEFELGTVTALDVARDAQVDRAILAWVEAC
ncbi:hypothetical protein [Nostoc sp. ChiQUE01b]|uniref:hypothetical protein n=1 Tax=Nostoc sp. ChiQUE01b TaxID=3075376 RepID=UPI002AD30171|nr:hypothetical protein [Nostoc sp. ChiQUE01b]MDZ8241834.1 hypothetical protein [Nostoc sp. ChiQUE01a]MDZ8264606.1 hypothetical protein [Nostoc sp. ChiQUE01b]